MPGLLATKLHRPAISARRVRRSRLIARLNEGLEAGRPLTLISAPPGFGKTTCTIAWINDLDLPVAWLSLDVADNDPGRFFRYLIAALQKVDQNLGRDIFPLAGQGDYPVTELPPAEQLSTALINAILDRQEPFVLVLDDFHVIQEVFILRVFDNLVTNLLQQKLAQPLHLVLITREDPALPVARLRANNQMTEIRASDLRFTSGEADGLLNEMMGLRLSRADIEALETRTEGWAAGLQLAGLSIRSQANPSNFIATLSGSHRHILSYLTEEVLNRQPQETQQFLLQTAILDRLNGDLCSAVTGRADSALLLEKLLNANLFLIALDDEQHWYRYHHLFADLLRSRQSAQPADVTAALHRHASRWYAQACDGLPSSAERSAFAIEAIQHALSAADYAYAVELIERHATELITQWYARTVSGWMRALPPEWAAQSPRANLAFAWKHLINREVDQAGIYLERLQAIFPNAQREGQGAANFPPALTAEWMALQSVLLNAQGKAIESLAIAEQGLKNAQEESAAVRSQIYMAAATAHLQLGDAEHAAEAYRIIIRSGRETGDVVTELMGVSGLGLMALQHGQLNYAFEIASQAIERAERAGPLPPISIAVYGELGQVYYHWHQLDQAQRYFMRSIQGSALSGFSDAEIYHQVILSRVCKMQGDLEGAAREIQKASDLMRLDAPAQVREEVVAQQVRIDLEQDRLIEAETALKALGFSAHGEFSLPDLPPEQGLTYPYGKLYNSALRVLLYRARKTKHRPDLHAEIDLCSRSIDNALKYHYLPIVLEALLLRSQMHAADGNEQASLDDAGRAIDLGAPEGFVSIFVEEGLPAARAFTGLLKRCSPGSMRAKAIEKILAAFSSHQPTHSTGEEITAPQPAELLEPLTGRELEVLRLIAEGLKYEEIASQLFLSINTVRSYVKEIYGKLNVNNRTKAIALARQYGLID